jgi:hypothetical protein
LIKKYVLKKLTPTAAALETARADARFQGRRRGLEIRATVGHIVNERTSGETIRDTYGDYVEDEMAKSPTSSRRARAAGCRERAARLLLWASYSDKDGGSWITRSSFPRVRSREDPRCSSSRTTFASRMQRRGVHRSLLAHFGPLHHRLQGASQ